jgi:O-antigen ligase
VTPRAVAFWIVAVLIGAAALAFGAVENWSGAWLRFGAAAAFAAAVWSDDPRELFRGRAFVVSLPVALFIAWGLVQSLPLPPAVVRVLSPRTARIQAETLPAGGGTALPSFLLAQAEKRGVTIEPGATLPPGPDDPGSRPARSGLSVNPGATRRACLAWLTPLLLMLAAERLSRDSATRYRLLWAVAGWTGVLGAIAVAQKVDWNGRLLWIRESSSDSAPLGPFVNPNHFAGYIELGVLVVFGLVLAILGGAGAGPSRADVRAALLDRAWALPRLLILGSAAVLGLCGLVLSGSRGGAISLFAGIVVLLPFGRLRAWLPAAVAIVLAVGLAVGLSSWLGQEERTLQTAFFAEGTNDPSLAARSDIWGRTWRILLDHPVTGTGLGTFPSAYASYDREGEWLGTAQAHNDYLQLVSETGVVGVVLLAWLVAAFALRVLLPALRPAHGRPRWTTTALAAAVFAMLVHSILDFNMQIPAVAALFAVIGGMLIAAADDPAPASDASPTA